MARRSKFLITLLVAFGLIAAGCSSDPESLIVGDDGAAADESEDTNAATVESEPLEEAADDQQPVDLSSPDDLLGTAWTVDSVDGKPYDGEGALSFYGELGRLRMTWIDECSTGTGSLFLRDGGYLFSSGGGPNNECLGHPTSLFDEAYETVPIAITVSGTTLTLEGDSHFLSATHFQSQSIHDRPLPLPGLAYPDLVIPDVQDFSTIPEATNIPFPECPTDGRIGLEDDPLEEEHLAASQRLSQITGALPFVVWSSAAGGNLRHHEAGLGVGVRYQPTIDWLAANFAPTDLCLDLPPIGYYDTPPTLIPWRLADDFELAPDLMSVLVVHDLDCDVSDWSRLLDPQVQYLDDEIRIGLPQLPWTYGQSSDDMCRIPQPFEVQLTEAVADRPVIPASPVLR